MRKSDQLATSFTTPYNTFFYVTMPFGLKNAGATYQRTMQRCLHDQIGRNAHAYVDDITVMSKKSNNLISDLKETFDNLRKYEALMAEYEAQTHRILASSATWRSMTNY